MNIWEDIGKLYCDADMQSEGDNTQSLAQSRASVRLSLLQPQAVLKTLTGTFPVGLRGLSPKHASHTDAAEFYKADSRTSELISSTSSGHSGIRFFCLLPSPQKCLVRFPCSSSKILTACPALEIHKGLVPNAAHPQGVGSKCCPAINVLGCPRPLCRRIMVYVHVCIYTLLYTLNDLQMNYNMRYNVKSLKIIATLYHLGNSEKQKGKSLSKFNIDAISPKYCQHGTG